jgi:hypothetical protein
MKQRVRERITVDPREPWASAHLAEEIRLGIV